MDQQIQTFLLELECNANSGSTLIHEHINPLAACDLMMELRVLLGKQQLFLQHAHNAMPTASTGAEDAEWLRDAFEDTKLSVEQLVGTFAVLQNALATHGNLLMHETHLPLGDGSGAQVASSMINTVFIVMTRCLLCAFLARDFEQRRTLLTYAARDNACCLVNHLAISELPVLSYPIDIFNNALLRLSQAWPLLKYDLDLVRYVQLLVIRFAQLVGFAHTAETANVARYRQETPAAERQPSSQPTYYSANALFTRNCCGILCAMLREIAVFEMFDKHEELAFDQGALACVDKWIKDAPRDLGLDQTEKFISDTYPLFAIEPGQDVIYRLEHNGQQAPLRGVLTCYRGRVAQSNLTLATYAPTRLAKAMAEESQDESTSLLVQLLYAKCIETAIYQCANKTEPDDVFVHTEARLLERYEALVASELPYMVRVFHHYQVVHNGRLYVTNSAKSAFALWLGLVRTEEKFTGLVQSIFSTPVRSHEPTTRRRRMAADTDPDNARFLDVMNI